MDVTLRWCTDDDWERIALADSWSFGFHYEPQELIDRKPLHDLDRFLVAEIDGRIVGVTGDYPMAMTVPGGASVDLPGVTWVSVLPGHRRRGILRLLLAEQHRRFVDEGRALAILTASEGGIYGRFGYGPASVFRRVEIDRRRVRMRPGAPTEGGARLADASEALPLLPALHERWRALTPGAVSRSDAWWAYWGADRAHDRGGRTPRFYLLHRDGYAAYRAEHHWNDGHPDHLLEVEDLFASTPAAHADLWSFLLDLDLYGRIGTWKAPPDDPLPFLVDNPREVRTLVANDGLWVRVLDVPGALAARTYAGTGSLVLQVVDDVWGRGGTFRLEADGVATCQPTSASPDLVLSMAALGSAYLGGHRLGTLARAGLVEEVRPGALTQADVLFTSERHPLHGTAF